MQAASYITIYAEKADAARARHAIETDARTLDYLAQQAKRYDVLAESARESAQRDAVQVEAAQTVSVKVEAKPAKVRCPHYKAIRRFFAVAKSANLDTSNKKGMRAAFSAMLGKTVTTRADLQAADYGRAIQNIENGLMWW